MARCRSKDLHQKDMCLHEIDYVVKNANHYRFHSQHDWGLLYDHVISTRIATLLMNKIFK